MPALNKKNVFFGKQSNKPSRFSWVAFSLGCISNIKKGTMIFREATINDISQIQFVRNAVKENRLSRPELVTDEDCALYMTVRGKAWVAEIDGKIVGFTYVDLHGKNVWALFLLPEYEGKGLGKELHRIMLNWYFTQTKDTIWLSTAPGTRAEVFYEKQGWTKDGMAGKEVKFVMDIDTWSKLSTSA